MASVEQIARDAQIASKQLAATSHSTRVAVLRNFKEALQQNKDSIIAANDRDLTRLENSSSSLTSRLRLTDGKFCTALAGIEDVIALKDPLGQCTLAKELANELTLYKVSCPIGVLCVIYEARPEAGIQISSLALLSGNALLLKGGSDAKESNRAIFAALLEAMQKTPGIPVNSIQIIEAREQINTLLGLHGFIDLIIPRGSKQLVDFIQKNTRIPVMGHADGLCITYVDQHADLDNIAVKVVVDAKTQYPAGCNALETLLVHKDVCKVFLPKLAIALDSFNIEYFADTRAGPFLPAEQTKPASEAHFETEFLRLAMAVKTVDSVEEAVAHINKYGSRHTDVVITEDSEVAEYFMANVDSAGVYLNCSSRFADGYRYGFGAEVGIATGKLHARGPVGVEGLLSYKYKLYGRGHTVGDFIAGKAEFTHRNLPLAAQKSSTPLTAASSEIVI